MPKNTDDEAIEGFDETDLDEPIPAKRDVRIFSRKKEDGDKDEGFEEDVFV